MELSCAGQTSEAHTVNKTSLALKALLDSIFVQLLQLLSGGASQPKRADGEGGLRGSEPPPQMPALQSKQSHRQHRLKRAAPGVLQGAAGHSCLRSDSEAPRSPLAIPLRSPTGSSARLPAEFAPIKTQRSLFAPRPLFLITEIRTGAPLLDFLCRLYGLELRHTSAPPLTRGDQ